ncbi:MAG TPA: ABC transporter substrate-binding protein [Anaeromyxobacter sp.]|nr:ABC transporter substrate-binding protein [Anaeromyxobacter sp.]
MKIVHLVPTEGESPFYEVLLEIERAAAARLGVELEPIYCGGGHAKFVEAGVGLARRTRRPDYVVLPNFHGAARELLPVLDAAGIPTFLLNEGMSPTDRLAHGEPRTKHARWLGELIPDDVAAGRQLATVLVEEARARGLADPEGKISVGVVSGNQTSAGQTRFQGWLALKKERPEVIQASVQYANWAEDVARTATAVMLQKRPEIAVIWAANDAMALGAVEAARECGRTPGKDVLIGGIDLLARALRHVEDGTMAVTLGGHVLDGARALILLHDHFHGRDFDPPWSRRSLLEPVTGAQARAYRRFFETRAWQKVDFTQYSRVRAGSADAPELTLQGLV